MKGVQYSEQHGTAHLVPLPYSDNLLSLCKLSHRPASCIHKRLVADFRADEYMHIAGVFVVADEQVERRADTLHDLISCAAIQHGLRCVATHCRAVAGLRCATKHRHGLLSPGYRARSFDLPYRDACLDGDLLVCCCN